MTWFEDRLMLRNTAITWGMVTRLLHWVVGLAILGMLAYGFWMNHYAAKSDRYFHRSIHADIGYVILLLTALRLIWRAINPSPAFPLGTSWLEKALAHANHVTLYLLTFLVTGLGWALSGASSPDYSSWFGLFHVPQFTSPDRAKAHDYEVWHIYMAYVLLALIVVHLLTALYHHAFRRDRLVMRMIDGKAS
jgi:cytochrome b561